MFTLFCLVDGESTSNAFSVTVEPTETVGDLKGKIKEKQANYFKSIDYHTLTLWK
ncbi:hypothetical protein B0O80DRAFT_486630, partial [Mortierella sp. GBAus27b]